uniref:BAH domain-containing protein n=1 Tax=Anopheles dirus TaxID=7168 RepID=A0A182NCP4_9DIPT
MLRKYYVYVETSSTTPFQIRRIDELNKTPTGNVEAKVMCFYRRRDLPTSLVQLADKHQTTMTTTTKVVQKVFRASSVQSEANPNGKGRPPARQPASQVGARWK